MEQKKGLEPGEKYLTIVLLGGLRVAAFKNKAKTKAGEPDYRGDGVAVWVNAKKEPAEVVPTETVS